MYRQCQWIESWHRQSIGFRAVAGTAALFWTVLTAGIPVASAAPGDWPTYQFDNARTGFNSAETTITPANAQNLKLLWSWQAPGNPPENPNAISVQPVVVNNTIYWGSWNGYEYATTFSGGSVSSPPLHYLGQTSGCFPPTVGVASTATLSWASNQNYNNLTIYVGGGNADFYALNGLNGAVEWNSAIGVSTVPPSNFIWSSPAAVYKGGVYIGNSSFGDCPLIQGQLVQLNKSNGKIRNAFNVVPSGCRGGSVWGSPAIDEAAGTVYFATGNPDPNSPSSCASPYTEAVIEVNAANLSLVSSWQVQGSDTGDLDFGSTPTLFQANATKMAGVVNKNGTFYAFRRDALSMGPVWSAKIGNGGACPACDGNGEISPAAWDGSNLYVASSSTTINNLSCKGSLRKLDPATGNFIWQTCLTDGPVLAPVAVANGVAYIGEGSHFVAIDTSSGKILFNSDTGSAIWGGASISNGVVYVGNSNGVLYAFGP